MREKNKSQLKLQEKLNTSSRFRGQVILDTDDFSVEATRSGLTLEKAVRYFKDYEHGKLKEISGHEIEALLKESEEYIKNLKKLREKLEKSVQEKSAENLYKEVFGLLKTLFGDKPHPELIKEFDKELVKKAKIQERFLTILKNLEESKKKIKEGKLDAKATENVKKDAYDLIKSLVEYAQRKDLIKSSKDVIEISYSGRKAELYLMGEENFLIERETIRKFKDNKLVKSDRKELEAALQKHKEKLGHKIPGEIFAILQKELGSFELVI